MHEYTRVDCVNGLWSVYLLLKRVGAGRASAALTGSHLFSEASLSHRVSQVLNSPEHQLAARHVRNQLRRSCRWDQPTSRGQIDLIGIDGEVLGGDGGKRRKRKEHQLREHCEVIAG